MKLVERDFFVGESPTQAVWSTYVRLYTALRYRKSSEYPRYRKPEDEEKYRAFTRQHPPHLVKPEIMQVMGKDSMILLPNIIPYTAVISDDIQQYTLWLNPELDDNRHSEDMIGYLKNVLGTGVIAYVMQNVRANCSICDVPHLHAFVDTATITSQ